MIRIITTGFLFVSFIMGIARAQEAKTSGPSIVCDQATHKFGERDNSETVVHDFIIRNNGDSTLKISSTRTSCSCITAEKYDRIIPPGETGSVIVKVDLKGRYGKQNKTVIVESNDPKAPRLFLYMEGVATTDLKVSPRRVFFGQIPTDARLSKNVNIRFNGSSPMNLEKIELKSEYFTAEIKTIEEGKTYQIRIRTQGPLPAGFQQARILIHTDNPKHPVIAIPVNATVYL